jgi:hypothetical protein
MDWGMLTKGVFLVVREREEGFVCGLDKSFTRRPFVGHQSSESLIRRGMFASKLGRCVVKLGWHGR